MIGESRSASKVLEMAAAASRSSARQNQAKIAESDFLAIELDSSKNSKIRPKTLREKAAMIASQNCLREQFSGSKSQERKGG